MSQAKTQAKQPVNMANIKNWVLDHAMIIIIILMALYVQIQRPQFFGIASLVNILYALLKALSKKAKTNSMLYLLKRSTE